jgi:hypothetical protein
LGVDVPVMASWCCMSAAARRTACVAHGMARHGEARPGWTEHGMAGLQATRCAAKQAALHSVMRCRATRLQHLSLLAAGQRARHRVRERAGQRGGMRGGGDGL